MQGPRPRPGGAACGGTHQVGQGEGAVLDEGGPGGVVRGDDGGRVDGVGRGDDDRLGQCVEHLGEAVKGVGVEDRLDERLVLERRADGVEGCLQRLVAVAVPCRAEVEPRFRLVRGHRRRGVHRRQFAAMEKHCVRCVRHLFQVGAPRRTQKPARRHADLPTLKRKLQVTVPATSATPSNRKRPVTLVTGDSVRPPGCAVT